MSRTLLNSVKERKMNRIIGVKLKYMERRERMRPAIM